MKIIRGGSTYHMLSTVSFYEDAYVKSILFASGELFPGYFCGPFSSSVESEYGTHQPDLVLIDKLYRNWVIVEAELEHHSLSGHVEPQIRCFMNGLYTDSHVDQIHALFPTTSRTEVKRLVRTMQPEVAVIAPEIRERWIPVLKSLGATLTVFQVYENDHGERLYAVDGEEVRRFGEDVLGTAVRMPSMRTGLRISGVSDDALGQAVDLLYNDELTRWKVVRTGSDIMLLPADRCPLPEAFTESYLVCGDNNGIWRLQVNGD